MNEEMVWLAFGSCGAYGSEVRVIEFKTITTLCYYRIRIGP